MKEHWNRSQPYVEMSADQLTALLKPAFAGQRVVQHELMTGGLSNTLYKVHVSDREQPLVVRLYTGNEAVCQKEVDLFDRIQGTVPVPRIFYADPRGDEHGVPYAITEWIAGTTLRDVLNRNDDAEIARVMYAVGATLAAIGKHTFEQPGFFGPGLTIAQPLAWSAAALQHFVAQCLDNGAAELLGPMLSKQLPDFIERYGWLLNDLPAVNALVHADYNEPNMLLQQTDGAWRVAAVLDWEFAFAGPPLYDIGVLLRNDAQRSAAFVNGFAAGFADHGGQLPLHWRHSARMLDLINLCDFLMRARGASRIVADVTTLIAATIATVDRALSG